MAARREIFGDSDGIAVLAEDLEFPTPSAAAVFVLGGSQNGWTEWVATTEKHSTKSIEVRKTR